MAQGARRRGRLISRREPHLRAGRLPALRRAAVRACLSDDGDTPTRRRHRHHRLRSLYWLRLLRGRLSVPGPIPRRRPAFRLRRGDAERGRARRPRAPRRGAKMHVLLGPHRLRPCQRLDAGARTAGDAGLRQFLHCRCAALWRYRRPGQQRLAAVARAEAFSHARRARHRAEFLLSLRQGGRRRIACWPHIAFTRSATGGKNPQPRCRTLAPAALELEGGRQFSLRRHRDRTVRRCGRRRRLRRRTPLPCPL